METEINNTNTQNQGPPQAAVAKKKRGILQIIKIAVFMLKHKSTPRVSSKSSLWKRIVGAMRSLHSHQQHLEHHPSPPSASPPLPPPPPKSFSNVDIPTAEIVDNLQAPMSPHMSQYASAQNLQELDHNCDYDDVGDGKMMIDDDGDVMIDARAEEYIAHFYEEMKLERFKSVNRCNQLADEGTGSS